MSSKNEPANDESEGSPDPSRRRAIFQSLALASVIIPASPALAGKPSLDKATGSLYSPKSEMLSGGSAAARGMMVQSSQQNRLQPGQTFQTVYETRFITYLARFLLNYDPAANAWWGQNSGMGDTWDLDVRTDLVDETNRAKIDQTFAEFAESVEIGLADYFVGPYGSYSSLKAAKAGISAAKQVKSARPNDPEGILGFMGDFFMGRTKKDLKNKNRDSIAKQGVLNLYTLLKARYTSESAKRQLAILFSFFSNSDLQPTAEIKGLLGEVDDASVTSIKLFKARSKYEEISRTSSRRGGGYDVFNPPKVSIEAPPALGSSYREVIVKPVMKTTTRVLRIRVTDGGEGYTKPPDVTVAPGWGRQCSACAILDREGHVESVLVLDPGYGYGRKGKEPPRVTIAAPEKRRRAQNNASTNTRTATAVADLEYEIVGIDIVQGGNGYVATDPPKITIDPPEEDPDWFLDIQELADMEAEIGPFRAEVTTMKSPSGEVVYSIDGSRPPIEISLDRIQNEPLELLPSAVRPELNSLGSYIIPPIAAVRTYSESPNPRYRAAVASQLPASTPKSRR